MDKKGWLFVLPWSADGIGGVSRVVVELCRTINKEGCYKPFILVEDWLAAKPLLVEKADYTEIRLKLRPFSATLNKEFFAFFTFLPITLLRLYKIYKKYNIKVVNPHFPSLSCVYFAFFKCINTKITFLLSFHGADLVDIRDSTSQTKTIWNFIFKNVDSAIACSKGMAKKVMHEFGSFSEKINYVHNGIAASFFEEDSAKSKNEKFELPKKYILSVGTYEYKKGQDLLITAFSTIADHFTDVYLVLVGRTARELSQYKQLAENSSYKERIVFVENIPLEEVKIFYKKAMVYVSASRDEPFGIVMLEAAAFKVPVIATKTIGACEIIEDDIDGILVNIEDTKAMAEQITYLLTDEQQRQRLANALYQKAKVDFTWDKALKKYCSFIQ